MATPFIYTLEFLITVFLLLLLLLLLRLYYTTRPVTTKNQPPSPPKLPIIGNLHQIGPIIHHSLYTLSRRYGNHLMLLHLGSTPTLVVSSSESARKIMQTQDLKFASRAPLYVHKKLLYDSKDLAVAPYGEHWKQAKKILVLHFLSNNMVKTFSGLREKEISITLSNVEKLMVCNKAVNLRDLFFEHVNNILCTATFGRKLDDREMEKKFMMELFDALSRFYFVDYIPQLAWVDRISGACHKLEVVAKYLDHFLEVAVEERLTQMDSQKPNNELGDQGVEPFIDALLRIHKGSVIGLSLDRDGVKALLVDSYLGGIDTTSSMLEWVMAELLTHPSALKQLQAEVRAVVNGKQHITDDDVEQMKYLKAVILETARLHPPVLPFPRVSIQDASVMGFDIAKGTTVVVNVWAIGRDPKVWNNPNDFVPERFVEGSLDFIMHDFKMLPFGAGRRSCPGRAFSLAIVEKLLANLLYKFDWASPEGVNIDMSEAVAFAIQKKTPLLSFATPLYA